LVAATEFVLFSGVMAASSGITVDGLGVFTVARPGTYLVIWQIVVTQTDTSSVFQVVQSISGTPGTLIPGSEVVVNQQVGTLSSPVDAQSVTGMALVVSVSAGSTFAVQNAASNSVGVGSCIITIVQIS
jgi:hypothetical protein